MGLILVSKYLILSYVQESPFLHFLLVTFWSLFLKHAQKARIYAVSKNRFGFKSHLPQVMKELKALIFRGFWLFCFSEKK